MIKPGDYVRFSEKEHIVLSCAKLYNQIMIPNEWGFTLNAQCISGYRNQPDFYDIINNIEDYIDRSVSWINIENVNYIFSTDIIGPRKILETRYFSAHTDFDKLLDTLIPVGKQRRKMRVCEISGDYTKIYVEHKND